MLLYRQLQCRTAAAGTAAAGAGKRSLCASSRTLPTRSCEGARPPRPRVLSPAPHPRQAAQRAPVLALPSHARFCLSSSRERDASPDDHDAGAKRTRRSGFDAPVAHAGEGNGAEAADAAAGGDAHASQPPAAPAAPGAAIDTSDFARAVREAAARAAALLAAKNAGAAHHFVSRPRAPPLTHCHRRRAAAAGCCVVPARFLAAGRAGAPVRARRAPSLRHHG